MISLLLTTLLILTSFADKESLSSRHSKRKLRRKLQSDSYVSDASCCECTETEPDAGCTPAPECEYTVCPLDPFCCNYYWDGICANGANNVCNAAYYWSWPTEEPDFQDTSIYYDFYTDSYYPADQGTTGSCCDCTSVGDGPGCNAVCDNEVCPLDSYCCNNYWDSICANGANNLCQGYEYWSGPNGGYGYSDYDYPDSYYSDSFDYNNYDYSFYSPSGELTYSDEPYSNSFSDYADSYYYSSYPEFEDSYSDYPYYSDSYYYSSYPEYQDSYDYYSAYYPDSYYYSDSYDYGSGYDDYPSYDDSCYYYDSGEQEYYPPYDYDCNCDQVCGEEGPEDWEFDYEEIPQCIKDECGQALDACADSEACKKGVEGVVAQCYSAPNIVECMDSLFHEEQGNPEAVNQLCGQDTVCANDLTALGQCVINDASYGECSEGTEAKKKLSLKSLSKTVKKRSRLNKRKKAALKQKKLRSSKHKKGGMKYRGKRRSSLKKQQRGQGQSRRQLQEEYDYGDEYPESEYDYGCYCDCGEEEDMPPCLEENCYDVIETCFYSESCYAAVDGIEQKCFENNEDPIKCLNNLFHETEGEQDRLELCNNDQQCANDLQALGSCVINNCPEIIEEKKFKLKSLLRGTKRLRAKKMSLSLKQRKLRSLSLRQRRQRSAQLQKRKRLRERQRSRSMKLRQRSRSKAQSMRLREQKQRSMKLRQRPRSMKLRQRRLRPKQQRQRMRRTRKRSLRGLRR